MYFFIQKSKELSSRAEQFGIDFQDIYIAAMQEMQAEYSLPALHEWGDGYVQGDASNGDIFELAQNINNIEDADEPTVYCEIDEEEEDKLFTDVYEYLDKKLIEKIETQIESQILTFGEDEYSSSQFDEYKGKAEETIKELLKNEYYESANTIGHDYSVFFLADEIKAFEHIEASSNWTFQKANEARFRICHLNNYEKAFSDFSDFVSESSYTDIRSYFSNEESEIVDYLKSHCEFDADDFLNNEENPHPLDDIKTLYKELSFEEKIEMWKTLDNEDVIEDFNKNARSEAIEEIIEAIEWEEIETWFNAQFVKEEQEA